MKKFLIVAAVLCCAVPVFAGGSLTPCTNHSVSGTAVTVTTNVDKCGVPTDYLTFIAPFNGTDPSLCAGHGNTPCKTFRCAGDSDCLKTPLPSCVSLLLTDCPGETIIRKVEAIDPTNCGPV